MPKKQQDPPKKIENYVYNKLQQAFHWMVVIGGTYGAYKYTYEIAEDQPSTNSVYLFGQQTDNNCHIAPFVNLYSLQNMRNKSSTDGRDLSEFTWLSHSGWFPVIFNYSKTWQQSMAWLTTDTAEPKGFYEYNQANLAEGIISGKIYTETGEKFYEASWNKITQQIRSYLTPHTVMVPEYLNKEAQKLAEKNSLTTLPLEYYNGMVHYITTEERAIPLMLTTALNEPTPNDTKTRAIAFPIPEQDGNQMAVKFVKYNVPLEILDQLSLPKNLTQLDPLPKDDYDNYDNSYAVYFKYKYLPQATNQTCYIVSLYDLILFSMGLDRQNNQINEQHPLFSAYKELRHSIQQEAHNPWNLPTFHKDYLFEYHLTNLFKNNPQLAQIARKVVNFHAPGMELYDQLDTLYDSPDPATRKSLKDKKKYLPSQEQLLAFYFSNALRSVWAAAKTPKALSAILEMNDLALYTKTLLWMGSHTGAGPAVTAEHLITAANKKYGDYNFLETWELIKPELLKILKEKDIMDLVSWSGHGTVMSFAADLNHIQLHATKVTHPDIMQKLGFALIDSLYADDIDAFYKRSREARDQAKPTELFITNTGDLPENIHKNIISQEKTTVVKKIK